MSDENLPLYIEALRKFKPDFFHVYASSVYILADYMKRHNIEPFPSLKCILAGSENVYAHQRQFIEEVFKCRMFSHYGQTEEVCLAGECEKSSDYHIFWQYGYTEIRNVHGLPVSEEGEEGEIIATGFDNFAMPLIRYKTMDIAENTLRKCSCGRNYKLVSRVKGRIQEVLVTPSGRYISMTVINSIHEDVFNNVRQFQLYQDDPSCCTFYIVIKKDYSEATEKAIYRALKEKLDDLEVRIKYVEEIPKTPAGKQRVIIQKLPVKFSPDVYNG